ncbi:flagellar assembly protein A [Gracilibacillus halophilus]|uniref:flagellar assembly protein A n=1 Tax=Gracilibacillus halophilus TaxID=470864 RepID=UPI0003A8B8B0|nr:flagellar assembly protein A [Gracilibacillus halophilus]
MKQMVSKGKTVEAAVTRGLQLMDLTKDQVDIEVLQVETEGFIGLGKKQAAVKLTKQEFTPHDTDDEDTLSETLNNTTETLEDLVEQTLEEQEVEDEAQLHNHESSMSSRENWNISEGTAWVKNNQIHMAHASEQFPTARIGDGITLFQNGEQVNRKTVVLRKDTQYDISFDEEIEKPKRWRIIERKHGLEAVLEITPGEKTKQFVADVPPSDYIELHLNQTTEIVNDLTANEIYEQLEALNISYGIHDKEIERAASTIEENEFIIASGKESKAGMDGELEVRVKINAENALVEDEHGNIDFRDSNMIPNIEAGTIML